MTGAQPDGRPISFHLNGERVALRVPETETLVQTLRERCDVSSVRESCGIGVCGTCTVLRSGSPISACLTLTTMVEGSNLLTSEGLVQNGIPSLVQDAFLSASAFQCSFCIPGISLTVHALTQCQDEDAEDPIEGLVGNLCRCGTYPRVVEAVRQICATDPHRTIANESGVQNEKL